MNRFTKDMATIDDMLPLVLFDLIQVLLVQEFSSFKVYICSNATLVCSRLRRLNNI